MEKNCAQLEVSICLGVVNTIAILNLHKTLTLAYNDSGSQDVIQVTNHLLTSFEY